MTTENSIAMKEWAAVCLALAEGRQSLLLRKGGIAEGSGGFRMEHAARLFQAFRRLHSEQEFGGVGLGLATVQRIVTRYGGSIWVEAEADVGAKFFFTLPNAQECEEADAPTSRSMVDASLEEAPVRQGEHKTGTPTLRFSRG